MVFPSIEFAVAPARTADTALYLSFFAHVVAGPIVQAREFLPQLAAPRNPRNVAVGAGVTLIAILTHQQSGGG
jgi:D-alanyl-lipoteichoic acid acyltransferase DltB (MBOAT superfamily)